MGKINVDLNYCSGKLPDYILESLGSSSMQRLIDVGMHCGLEYTSLPYFKGTLPYSRYAHSLGVAKIVLHFGGSQKEALAGLLHDISTPIFSHVVDFLLGDPTNQEATEGKTEEIILNDPKIQEVLRSLNLKTGDVSNYHLYPLCDNASPKLSADRLEYTLSNFINFHFLPKGEAQSLYDDLVFENNEFNEKEIQFKSLEKARVFGLKSISNSIMYSRAEDRYAMSLLSRVLQSYLDNGTLTKGDLYLTEKEAVGKMSQEGVSLPWKVFSSLSCVECGQRDRLKKGYLFTDSIETKKRYIDPLVLGKGRLSSLDEEFSELLKAFLDTSFDVKLSGYSSILD